MRESDDNVASAAYLNCRWDEQKGHTNKNRLRRNKNTRHSYRIVQPAFEIHCVVCLPELESSRAAAMASSKAFLILH